LKKKKGFGGLSAGGEIKPLSGRVTGSEIRLRDDELANIYISFGVQGLLLFFGKKKKQPSHLKKSKY